MSNGIGGSYELIDGQRVLVEQTKVVAEAPATEAVPVAAAQPAEPVVASAAQALVAAVAVEVIAALPSLSNAELAELAALEAAGKRRVTVLDAITTEQAARAAAV